MNVSGCHFFHEEAFSDTSLLHMYFQVRRHSLRLPLCFQLSHGNKKYWDGNVRPLLPHHQSLPVISWANIMKEEALLLDQSSHVVLHNFWKLPSLVLISILLKPVDEFSHYFQQNRSCALCERRGLLIGFKCSGPSTKKR